MATGVTWQEASTICQRYNGYLVTIMQPNVTTILHYLLTTIWFSTKDVLYIGMIFVTHILWITYMKSLFIFNMYKTGLTDSGIEGIYRWVNGKPMVYSAW